MTADPGYESKSLSRNVVRVRAVQAYEVVELHAYYV
jgi:hypothetical protein